MAKRDDKRNSGDKLDRTIRRNWIICAVSGALIVLLLFFKQ